MSQDRTHRAPESRPNGERECLYLLVVEPQGCFHYALPESAGEVLVGRDPSEGVQLDSRQVSRKHARVRVLGGTVEVEDLGSTNGTWCGSTRLRPGQAQKLGIGDQIRIGTAQLVLQYGRVTLARQCLLEDTMIEILLHRECARREREEPTEAPSGPSFTRLLVARTMDPQKLDTVLLSSARQALDWRCRVAVYGDCTTTERGEVARWREYALLLPGTGAEQAGRDVAELAAKLGASGVECRYGVATFPNDGQSWHTLTQCAYGKARGSVDGSGEAVPMGETMARIEARAEQCAAVDSTVLLLGATGVGKTTLAERIHQRSKRAGRPFVTVNCPALPEGLADAELFGYEGGAFTGADKRGKPGLFKMADGGTLFLDEVGRLPLSAQSKLLAALSQSSTLRSVRRLGAAQPETVDVRIIAATNEDLAAKVKAGRFLEDLLHRLAVIDIVVPSLRERREAIAPLARNYVKHFAARNGLPRAPILATPALEALERHDWPGNLRELFNVVERAVTLCDGHFITLEDLAERVRAGGPVEHPLTLPPEGSGCGHRESVRERFFGVLKAHRWDERQAARALGLTDEQLGAQMKSMIKQILDELGGNVSETRRVIGASPEKMYKLLRQLGITRE